MGLDTSHDCWHGAYSAFSRWRNRIAEAAGYQVAKIGDGLHEIPVIDYGHLTEQNYYGEWAEMPPDPLILLIAHSDCEGKIVAAHCAPLADRLETLLPVLGEEDGGGHIGSYREKTEAFIKGLREAAAAGEDVEFH